MNAKTKFHFLKTFIDIETGKMKLVHVNSPSICSFFDSEDSQEIYDILSKATIEFSGDTKFYWELEDEEHHILSIDGYGVVLNKQGEELGGLLFDTPYLEDAYNRAVLDSPNGNILVDFLGFTREEEEGFLKAIQEATGCDFEFRGKWARQ